VDKKKLRITLLKVRGKKDKADQKIMSGIALRSKNAGIEAIMRDPPYIAKNVIRKYKLTKQIKLSPLNVINRTPLGVFICLLD